MNVEFVKNKFVKSALCSFGKLINIENMNHVKIQTQT